MVSTENRKIHTGHVKLQTPDHWNIAVYSYLPEKVTRKYPVMLLHGIASNHNVWDFGVPEYSYARHLAEQGYAVYSLDLRGRAGSDGPHTGRGKQWSIDDYLLCDLPTVVEYVIEQHNTEKMHWVGHSMGGILGFFYQIRHKASNLQSLTTFATALNYTYSTINHFRSLLDYISALQYYPLKTFYKPMIPFASLNTFWNRFLWNPENMDPEIARKVLENMIEPIAVNEWNQIKLISAAEGMPRLSGGFPHRADDRRITVPTLMLAGDRDWLCALDGVEWTIDQLSCERKLIVFGKEYGSSTSYGHMDLVCGKTAPKEVWPRATDWINKRDAL
jgi:pimeloyl-ACP methyl ester carboxylesterase